jgi:hypothetical protein
MMKIETSHLEIRVLDDGLVRFRRKDRHPPTQEDEKTALEIANRPLVVDVLEVFPGARLLSADEAESLRQEQAGKCPKCGEQWTPYKAGKIAMKVCWCEVKGNWITEPWKRDRL